MHPERMDVVVGLDNGGNANKPTEGHFAKANLEPKRHIVESHVEEGENFRRGQKILVDIFEVGTKVDVAGVSKGKGFAGVMKRHNFKGGPGGHGSHFHRAPGSIGMCAFARSWR